MPITPNTVVNEDSACRISFTLQDFDGNAIGSSAINTATMTITDKETEAVINSRQDVDVSGDFSAGGVFTRILTADDNQIVGESDKEVHIVTFEINATVNATAIDFRENLWLTVRNLKTL